MTSTTTTKRIFRLAATTVGTAGVLAVPLPVSAMPPFPLAPGCTEWVLNDGAQAFDVAGGRQIYVPWATGTSKVRPDTDKAVIVDPPTKGTAVSGGIDPNGTLDILVRWGNGANFGENTPYSHFSGTVNELGVASGKVDEKGSTQTFTARTPFTCNAKTDAASGGGNAANANAAGPVTNAITPKFDGTSNTTFKVTLTNSSKLPASCNYEAVSQSPLLPSDTTRTFDVPPNAPHTESFDGVKTGTNYTITINCTDSSGSQTEPLGSINQTVKW
jgi:hypothetical protein